MADKRKGRKKVGDSNLPKGTILTDISKARWELLETIGVGGFGTIYSAKKLDSKANNIAYAAKVEPHGNGPLFVERNFFLRNLKPEMVEQWKKQKKLSFLGIPQYIGSGTYKHNNTDHRFLIMERFGENVNIRLNNSAATAKFPLLVVFCKQIIDSLMYIHDKGYAHMDIKPENLLLKYNSKMDQVYLIDFGIIDKYTTDKELKPDKKKQHNGTLLYCSRDSHLGVGTMRGDLEILGYNILEWCGFQLPWAKELRSPAGVQEKKNSFMSNLHSQLDNKVPKAVIEYFNYVNTLKHDQAPDYELAKSILSNLGKNEQVNGKSAQKRKSKVIDESPSPKKSTRKSNVTEDSPSPKKSPARAKETKKPVKSSTNKSKKENSIKENSVSTKRAAERKVRSTSSRSK